MIAAPEEFISLKGHLAEVIDLEAASAVLGWDQSTYMPAGGSPARARQQATLGKLAHEKACDPEIGRLLDSLAAFEGSMPYDSDEASLIRIAQRDYLRRTRVPASFMATLYSHMAESYDVWTRARAANDFAAVQPYLERTVDLSRQLAQYFPGYEHIADPLIDFADYGMKASSVRTVFAELRQALVPLVQSITAQEPLDAACLRLTYPVDEQRAFLTEIIRDLGYDFNRGRQDVSPHPFTTGFSVGDVRITVRYKVNDLGEALFSAIHEAGHAMYEQGVAMEYDGTPLANGTSAGVHESQSRLWENVVGRSREFWSHYYSSLQTRFPEQLAHVDLDTFYRAINKVERSLIRTDADEVTYNLHVMLRFDFELALLEGSLAVRDLPEAWRERFHTDIGIEPPDDRDGVLQDVHWYGGSVGGAFQGYTLGNILSAQFYQTALAEHPDIPEQIRQGQFGTLHGWLKDKIYRHGRKFTAPELVERVTGGPLQIAPYIAYLRTKYGSLYQL